MSSELDELRAAKDHAYWERNQLVAALSKIYPAWLARHPESDTTWEDDWRWIVFIQLPAEEGQSKQVSWHIHDTDFQYFTHLSVKQNNWDGHTSEEKYQRLSHLKAWHMAIETRTIVYCSPPGGS